MYDRYYDALDHAQNYFNSLARRSFNTFKDVSHEDGYLEQGLFIARANLILSRGSIGIDVHIRRGEDVAILLPSRFHMHYLAQVHTTRN